MSHVHTWAANKLTLHQHARGIYGAVGELGVWQGKLFIGMAGFSHPDEPLLAADWFTDDTDAGYLKGFVDNVRDYLGAATLAKTLIFQVRTAQRPRPRPPFCISRRNPDSDPQTPIPRATRWGSRPNGLPTTSCPCSAWCRSTPATRKSACCAT